MDREEAVAVATDDNSMADDADRSGSHSSPAHRKEDLGEEDQPGRPEERELRPTNSGGGESDREKGPEDQGGEGRHDAEDDLERDLSDRAPLEEEEEVEEDVKEVMEEEGEASSQEEEERKEPETVAVQEEEVRELDKENEAPPPPKEHNGGLQEDTGSKQEKSESHRDVLSPEAEEASVAHQCEAERIPDDLKRCRSNTDDEMLERMRQKQQEAQAELQELKKRREERRKVLEEAEKQKKQEMEARKAREEEEKRRMKEEIKRRRAEAAEKRQKIDSEAAKPVTCVAPRGALLKIGDRAEFLNKSVQKSSTVKTSHTPIISKIDNRLEQYNTALQSHREGRPPRPALDLPVVAEGIRSLKNRWEEGDTFGHINVNKESAHVNIGVSGLISDWLNKSPEAPRPAGGTPADLKPGDVTNKRSLWENRSSSANVPAGGDASKLVTNGKLSA